MKKLKVGVVGIGAQTRENLLPALLQIPDVDIVAACDSILLRAESVKSYVSESMAFDAVDKMLDNVELDALVLACPPEAHRDVSMLAMGRGVNVFVEKPPCFTIQELKELVRVAENEKVVTAVGLNFRFARPVQQVRSIVSSDTFGLPRHVQINHYANKPRTPLWGMDSTLRSFLLAQAIHSIDLATAFSNSKIAEIESHVQNESNALLAQINMKFESGLTASVLTGTMFPYFEFQLKVVSNRSTMIELDNLWNITVHEIGYSSPTTGSDKRWRSAWQPGPLDSGYERSGYLGELNKFFEAIREGKDFEGSFASMLPTYQVIEHVVREDAIARNIDKVVADTLHGKPIEAVV